jgi:hypothetical protein
MGNGMIHLSDVEAGKNVRTRLYNRGDSRGETRYSYDRKGLLTETLSYTPGGSLEQKTLYKYDDRGNQIEEADYKPDRTLGRMKISTYEYDSIGNWTKRTIKETTLTKPVAAVIERRITYFK